MSHSTYSFAELEAMRKAKMRTEIDGMISKLVTQKSKENEKKWGYSNLIVDDSKDDFTLDLKIDMSVSINKEQKNDAECDEEKYVDISSLVFSNDLYKKKIENLINEIKETEVRIPLMNIKEELLGTVERYLEGQNTDKDVLDICREMIINYIKEEKRYNILFDRYIVLCDILDIVPNDDISLEKLEKIIQEYEYIIQKQKEREYILSATIETLKELGYKIEKSFVLQEVDEENLKGFLLDNEELIGSRLFIGMDGDGLVLETMLDDVSEGVSAAMATESAKQTCSHKKQVSNILKEKGVFVEIDDDSEPDLQQMYKLSSYEKREKDSQDNRLVERKEAERTMIDE